MILRRTGVTVLLPLIVLNAPLYAQKLGELAGTNLVDTGTINGAGFYIEIVRFVEADGHCNFTPAQTGSAFDALLAWVRLGESPAPGEQR